MCDRHKFFFEFDKAFTAQLIAKFQASPEHSLAEDVAPPEKGVYAIYRKSRLVYAGKALQTTLRRRLAEHIPGKFQAGETFGSVMFPVDF